MKRAPSKKALERRKKPRSTTRSKATADQAQVHTRTKATSKLRRTQVSENTNLGTNERTSDSISEHGGAVAAGPSTQHEESCQNCSKVLMTDERALFVEEEVGRIFCSESCIASYFSPEIERLEKEYYRKASNGDLTKEERENHAHLRWITLQEPDEIWREKTLAGDHRYTLISEFQPTTKKLWSVCICLFLKGEPSFLYLAFTSKNAAMIASYRKGERVEWASKASAGAKGDTDEDSEIAQELRSDRLAGVWTEDETFLAQVNQERRADDIAPEDFAQFEKCLEETLETPDEVWTCQLKTGSKVHASEAEEGADSSGDAQDVSDTNESSDASARLFHFIRYYGDTKVEIEGDSSNAASETFMGVWYIIVARETEDEEQIEIVDAFPTRDSALVDRYRRGEQEVGHTTPGPLSRVVH